MPEIKNALPVPEVCDACCSSNIELTTNDRIYGRTYGDWPKVYFCNDCKAAVGCHPGTEIPLGRMADRRIRQLRAKAHKAFDQLWRSGAMSRAKAYQWLAGALQIPVDECHISWLPEDLLNLTIEVSSKYYEDNSEALQRRKAKQDEKRYKREKQDRRQTANHIKRRKAKRKP
ncbi:MAG: hypothetical protein CMH23_07230 [Methylophaga sp.]|uniref:zinc-finger-containing protein n=1 Tax=Methylophaga sp. TaxID=2024840 RepID=UPI000C897E29|nr:zinc-finger-containing protein [Methylophaga sp.]MBN46250.1 hypothetical protein [Methylophaga sp.]